MNDMTKQSIIKTVACIAVQTCKRNIVQTYKRFNGWEYKRITVQTYQRLASKMTNRTNDTSVIFTVSRMYGSAILCTIKETDSITDVRFCEYPTLQSVRKLVNQIYK